MIPLKAQGQDKNFQYRLGMTFSNQMHEQLKDYHTPLGISIGFEKQVKKTFDWDLSLNKEWASSTNKKGRMAITEINQGLTLKPLEKNVSRFLLGIGTKFKNIYEGKENEINANTWGGYLKCGVEWRDKKNSKFYFETEFSKNYSKHSIYHQTDQIRFNLGMKF